MEDEDEWTDVRAALAKFGLPAGPTHRDAIVAALEEQLRLEAAEEGDQDLTRLLCVQLFSIGRVEDSLLIWRAKSCNFDTMCGLDVQFLCGGGLDATREYLRGNGTLDALKYLQECEAAGDFTAFSREAVVQQARDYFEADG